MQAQVAADEASGSYDNNLAATIAQQDPSTGAGMGLGPQNNFLYALGGATGNGYNKPNAPGLPSVIKDLLVIGAIVGALWLFLKLGGADQAKAFARKNKYGIWIVLGVAAAVGFYLYSKFKQTGNDAASTFTTSLKSLNPFASL